MQAQQAIRYRQQSVSTVIAVVATVIAAALAAALFFAYARPVTIAPASALAVQEVGGEQIAHNRSEAGLGGFAPIGGEQVAHNRSEEGLGNR